jgi:predicted hydrocarbon binding protein
VNNKFNFKELNFSVRPNLQNFLPLATYRLLRISGMKELFGESTKPVLYRLGKILSSYFDVKKENDLLALVKDLGIGIPEIVEKNEDKITIDLYECMTCAGLPITGELICDLECGFLAGGIEKITGRKTKGIQTKSWTAGNDYCEFVIEIF